MYKLTIGEEKAMFDANMTHLPKGKEFFAEVYSCDEDSVLYVQGIRTGSVLLCEMLQDLKDDPLVNIYFKGKVITYRSSYDEEFDSAWLVYAGNKDLTGFLPQEEHIKVKAKKILEEMK